MEIDVILDSRATAEDLEQLGKLAEDCGIRAVWLSSLIDSRDPFSNLAYLARGSSRIKMGPIAVNPFDMHPVRITTSLLTLNELCKGRAQIVIGAGGEALDSLGIKPERRVRAVRECIEIIKGARTGERLSYEGEIYKTESYNASWVSCEAPFVYVAANMEQMLRMAAKTADGIMMSDIPPVLVSGLIETAQQNLTDPDGFRYSNFYAWHVYDNMDKGVKEARQWLVLRAIFRRWVNETFLTPEECDTLGETMPAFMQALINKTHIIEGVDDALIQKLVDNMTLCTTRDNLSPVIDKLQRFKEAGLTEIALRLYQEPEQSIKLIGEKIIPELV